MCRNKIILYIKKIWKVFDISFIITLLLLVFNLINFLIFSLGICFIIPSLPYKYIYWSFILSSLLTTVHSFDFIIPTMKYKKDQENMIGHIFLWALIMYIVVFMTNGISGNISGEQNFVHDPFFSWIYLLYSVALFNYILHPIKEWIKVIYDKNVIKLFGDRFVKCHYREYNGQIQQENNEEQSFCDKYGAYCLVTHTFFSIIMLGFAFMFNTPKLLYIITSAVSGTSSVFVVYSRYVLQKKYDDNLVTNNQDLVEQNTELSWLEYYCLTLLVFHFIFSFVTFLVYLPKKLPIQSKNIYFMVQGSIYFVPLTILLVIRIIYVIIVGCKILCKQVTEEVNQEINENTIVDL